MKPKVIRCSEDKLILCVNTVEKLHLLLYMLISDTCIEFHCFNILQSIMSHISCTVRTCKSSKIKNPELTFFTIPDILSQKWTEVLMHHKPLAWKPKKHTKICELHFLKTSYSKHGGPDQVVT